MRWVLPRASTGPVTPVLATVNSKRNIVHLFDATEVQSTPFAGTAECPRRYRSALRKVLQLITVVYHSSHGGLYLQGLWWCV